ncbi:methyl-accepting chemotaxis protein [Pseudomonas brassicacearum]|nr:methyl-accepting chemotaxis protein [Pseudomonas brassicacearum]NJP59281.1 methyl-accepting chemotaxis protein [Pseudomonas brassicacearum]SDP21990.1 methyl-accepting chemotaxis sensory transducer with Cache sensor [Pseudomonas brassicacearum]
MFPNRLPILWKITLLTGLCLLAVVALLVGHALYRMSADTSLVKASVAQMLEAAARERMKKEAEVQALMLKGYLMSSYQEGLVFSRQVLQQRRQAQTLRLSAQTLRENLYHQVKQTLEANPQLLSLYVVFESNAIDASDDHFTNRGELGSNETGRFAPYWVQRAGKMSVQVASEALISDTTPMLDGSPFNTWFNCPKKNLKPCLLNPYFDESSGQRMLITTLAFPVIEDGKILAVVGMDISLDNLQQLAAAGSQDLYHGLGSVSIVSSAGLLAAHSSDASLLGQNLARAYPDDANALLESQRLGIAREQQAQDNLRLVAPMVPIPNSEPWALLLDVPMSSLLAPALSLQQDLDSRNEKRALLELSLGVAAATIGLILVWLTALGVTRPISRVAALLKDIAVGEGDLTRRLVYTRQDELGELVGWFNRFLDKLQPVISEVKRSVQETRNTADQSTIIANQTSLGMQQQYKEVDQVAIASQEMTASAHEVAHSAAQAADAAQGADLATLEGLDVISNTTTAIEHLANEMSVSMEEIRDLTSRSDQISSVLDVIRAIAEQTNLLALNAAIEAARAGDAGRGFAVVADEVRNLARRTQSSVQEVRLVIEGLQKRTKDVVSSMDSSYSKAQISVGQVALAVVALRRIGDAVSIITNMNLQIASAAEEQSAVVEEINRNVATIRDVTESLSTQAQESAKISNTLNGLANHQQALMDQFVVISGTSDSR